MSTELPCKLFLVPRREETIDNKHFLFVLRAVIDESHVVTSTSKECTENEHTKAFSGPRCSKQRERPL